MLDRKRNGVFIEKKNAPPDNYTCFLFFCYNNMIQRVGKRKTAVRLLDVHDSDNILKMCYSLH